MKSYITSFLMALLLFGGSVTSSAQFFSASTESESYAYFIKGADPRSGDDKNNIRYWKYNGDEATPAIVHTTTAPTSDDDAYKFKFYASATTGKYYIYSVGAQKYLYCKNTSAGQDRVGLKADKADDALWYIPNDDLVANGVVDFVPGSLNLTNTTVGWNINGGVSETSYIGLYNRSDAASKWNLIPADLTTLNNFRSLASSIIRSESAAEGDYTKSLATRPASFPSADYDAWTLDDAKSIVSSLNSIFPALPTGYYTIKNCATNSRPPHIYTNLTNNPNGYTLQSSTLVTSTYGVWKITNNGNGTITVLNSIGDPFIVMNNNTPASYSTLHLTGPDGKQGIYFTEAINASNGVQNVNGIHCLTTWTAGGINAGDNRWAFSKMAVTPYDVNIYAPSNYTLGWRYAGMETGYDIIKRGGFFVDYMDAEGSMSQYEFVLLDAQGNVVNGVTPVVDSNARTITATLSELPEGYYRIVSAFTGGTSASKSMTSSQDVNNTLGWEVTDVNNGEQYWHIQGDATTGYTIQSAYFDSKKYMYTASAGNSTAASSLVNESQASKYEISLINNSDQFTIKEARSTSPLHGRYMTDSWSSGTLITWEGDANSASAWYFVPATDVEAAIASLNTYTAGIDFSKQIGTTVGKYSEPDGTTTEGLMDLISNYATYKAEVNTAIASGDVATMETAYTNFKTYVKDCITTERTTAYNNLVINQPEVGKLYRFKGHASGKYMCPSNAKGKMALDASRDKAATVFMLVEGSTTGTFKLLNYGHGYFTQNTHDLGALKEAANSIEFSSSTTNVGCYTLYSNYSGSKWVVDNSTVVDRQGNYNANNCDWEIEEVTWLPIVIDKNYRFGTLVAPAALAIASAGTYSQDERLKFYTAKLGSDGYVVLTKVTENIKAGKPYVIELMTETGMSEGSQFMEIADNAPELTAENALRGGFETIAKPTDEGTIYTLQAAWINESTVSANEVAFRQYNGETIKGFRAYLPVTGSTRIAGMRINDGETTLIEGVQAEQSHKVDVYDLSGRRVQRAHKGLYIINGKKVIVK